MTLPFFSTSIMLSWWFAMITPLTLLLLPTTCPQTHLHLPQCPSPLVVGRGAEQLQRLDNILSNCDGFLSFMWWKRISHLLEIASSNHSLLTILLGYHEYIMLFGLTYVQNEIQTNLMDATKSIHILAPYFGTIHCLTNSKFCFDTILKLRLNDWHNSSQEVQRLKTSRFDWSILENVRIPIKCGDIFLINHWPQDCY